MSAFSTYFTRVEAHGGDFRNAALIREQRNLERKLPRSLSYHTVDIYPCEYGFNINEPEQYEHMFQQNVAIINSDNLNQKTLCTLPHEDIQLGALIHWMNEYWLVIERDANTEVYAKAKLLQCNHLLKWLSEDKQFMEQWCVVEDGTKLPQAHSLWRFGILETICKNDSLNCWDALYRYMSYSVALRDMRSRVFDNHMLRVISSRALMRSRFNDHPGRGSRGYTPKQGALNHRCGKGKIWSALRRKLEK